MIWWTLNSPRLANINNADIFQKIVPLSKSNISKEMTKVK